MSMKITKANNHIQKWLGNMPYAYFTTVHCRSIHKSTQSTCFFRTDLLYQSDLRSQSVEKGTIQFTQPVYHVRVFQ